MSARVLIVGVSTRAAAQSAARAGFSVTAIDAFADLDQHPAVRAEAVRGRFTPDAAVRRACEIAADAVVYLSNIDNHPALVGALARGSALWGNAPDVLRKARNPARVADALRSRGLAAARACRRPGVAAQSPASWLLKPIASGGGRGIRVWDGSAVPRGRYLQEMVAGVPGSVAFVAAGGRVVPIGLSRQLAGERAFGAAGYRYCGSILAAAGDPQFEDDERLTDAACRLAAAAAEAFGLVGVNGVDFIARGGVPYAIEVNPRWSASMELVERVYGLSVFGAHAAACAEGRLPAFDLRRARAGTCGAVGRAIVFARRDLRTGDTRAWLRDPDIRDVPSPGQRIAAGRPVCTVFAAGRDSTTCLAALAARAAGVYETLEAWELRPGGRRGLRR